MKEVLFLQIGPQFACFLSVYLSYVATYVGMPSISRMSTNYQHWWPIWSTSRGTSNVHDAVIKVLVWDTISHLVPTRVVDNPGPDRWQSQCLTMPFGAIHGCSTHLQSTPTSAQGPLTMNFSPGVPHPVAPPAQPVGPTLQGCTPPMVFHPAQAHEQTTSQPTPTPMSHSGIDLAKLEEILEAAMNQKLETMTETLSKSGFYSDFKPGSARQLYITSTQLFG